MREPEERIRLVLVDSQALFRSSLSRYLSAQPALEVVGECGDAAEALGILKGSPVDLVLLDLDHLKTAPHADLIAQALCAGYKGHFLILSGATDARELAAIVRLGISGIFLKSEAPDRLVQAIRLVATGALWIDQKTIQLLADGLTERPHSDAGRPGNMLTQREQTVLQGILRGLTNRKIGEKIGFTESKVKSVVQQLFVKAGVRTRSQLVRMALEGSLGDSSAWAKQDGEANPAPPPDTDYFVQPIASDTPAGHSQLR